LLRRHLQPLGCAGGWTSMGSSTLELTLNAFHSACEEGGVSLGAVARRSAAGQGWRPLSRVWILRVARIPRGAS
jgi:hypothetical protein